MTEPDDRSCACGMPQRWIGNSHFPIEFDERMNEYHIVHRGAEIIMRYCFWCGGKLPESRRGDLFTTPDPTEMAEVRSLLENAKSLEQAIKILGPADEIRDSPGCFGRK